MIRTLAVAFFLLITALGLASARVADYGPFFDCAKASWPDEKLICADPLLGRMDRLINVAYWKYEPAYGASKVEVGRALLADRKACGADRPCVAAAMYNALTTYGSAPFWATSYLQGLLGFEAAVHAASAYLNDDEPVPEKLGQCAVTFISALTTRFGEPLGGDAKPGAGSAVEFTNGGIQVDYRANQQLVGSRTGQRVVMCLLSVRRDCPKGDHRSKQFFTLNTVTEGTWILSDSLHSCGGA